MSDHFPLHTRDSAPDDSKGVLAAMQNKFGFDLNLFAKMATSSKTLKAYIGVNEIFTRSSFSPIEQQVVLLTISQYNGCDYCVAAHTTGAQMQSMPESTIRAAAAGEAIVSVELEGLRQFTRKMVDQRGNLKEGELEEFLAFGYSPENALEVITGIALKTISNYANHLMDTPIDEPFKDNAPKG
ncbi:MAG: carboxymuconolactone decarboxylase family protein [bacterium]|nr:carboxymuconolactone decarboxylase family protein [bacterium]